MIELERTMDPVRLSVLRSVLSDADIEYFVFDQGVGGLWTGVLAARVMVREEDLEMARFALQQAGLQDSA
jgi:hypothetical protein